MGRADADFTSGGERVAAWHFRPATDGAAPVVVMGHGFSLTRHDGLVPYAERFAAAGMHALVFDHRFLGDSGGEPRQRFRRGAQLADWRAAIAHAKTLDGVDGSKVVLWGFSFSAGHVVQLAGTTDPPAAVLALAPLVDGLARALATPPALSAWITPRAVRDALGRHTLVPVTAQPGEHGAMTLPGEADGFARAVPEGSPWRNEISPGVFLSVATIRPVRLAPKIACPLWVGIGDRDISVSEKAAVRLAERAPRGELHRYPYDHFDPFVGDAPERIASDQVAFLARHGLAPAY